MVIVRSNEIGDDGATKLSESLSNLQNLTELNMELR